MLWRRSITGIFISNESVSIFVRNLEARTSPRITAHCIFTNALTHTMRFKCQKKLVSVCSTLKDSSCMRHIVSHETFFFKFKYGLVHTKIVFLLFYRIRVIVGLICVQLMSWFNWNVNQSICPNHIWTVYAFDIERILGVLANNKSNVDVRTVQHFVLVRWTTTV